MLAQARDRVCEKFNLEKDSLALSMGMSGDYERAVGTYAYT